MENYLHGLLDEDNDPVIQQYLKYIDNGIPKAKKTKNVLIIGAGMAGMVAAQMLKKAGHKVTIVEANTRVGGRIKTFRNTKDKQYFEDDSVYGEAGAMRIPTIHQMVFKYIEQLKLKTEPFYYVSVDKAQAIAYRTDPKVVVSKTRNSLFYVNYNRVVQKDYFKDGANINELLDYNLETSKQNLYENQRADILLANVLNPLKAFIAQNPTKNWPLLIQRYGEYSMRRFLVEQTLYSDNAIEMIGVLQNLESRMAYDFLQSFIESNIIKDTTEFKQIVGGTDLLTTEFFKAHKLKENTYFDCRVTDLFIDKTTNKIKVNTHVEVERDPEFYKKAGFEKMPTPIEDLGFDEVIVTIPFSALRHVYVTPGFSQLKRKAIRELHYDSATKILIEFRQKWWEEAPYNIVGGGSITDLSNRFVYYPSMDIGGKGHGVILASYCWSDEASRWDSMDDDERYFYALKNLAILHAPNDPKEQERIKDLAVMTVDKAKQEVKLTGKKSVIGAATQSWMRDPYAFGEAAIFNPGQLHLLQKHIIATEWHGRAHFAGEHTSLKHAWIEGAIESGIRTALEVTETIGSLNNPK
ncbi:flavin monoamine oxidase family protein [Mucilaginibacter phyllosphaerae]|uniref:Tryptophan 2-monooxygenase n=1 Tax=Mucilaginibacter phyllosphaerae TaxID=1812349 RepID=A0A4Y8AEB0_9SPHI|nr:FAD-dependent oxidoreductase [Mucilaginibacter phyllosphaerae]MBB3970095.1 monoamine oxidase [Mucilaginibacter phyllosphaerae]TEW66485.1 FAD-binding protein [Mucilaginibacter phyllosphaerae]GGH09768.1 putative L-amino-acid oxidase YobN [Mucilaginibacter phyllosphaerae]